MINGAIVYCKICGKQFNYSNRGRRRYCSRRCQLKGTSLLAKERKRGSRTRRVHGTRHCSLCGTRLNSYNKNEICYVCIYKERETA